MSIKIFEIVTCIWNIIFFLGLIFCSVNAILSVKKQKNRFGISYVLELIMVLVNLMFMFMIDKGYVLYGENKFSGLNRMGDWLGFLILVILTMIPGLITLVSHMIYVRRGLRKEALF